MTRSLNEDHKTNPPLRLPAFFISETTENYFD